MKLSLFLLFNLLLLVSLVVSSNSTDVLTDPQTNDEKGENDPKHLSEYPETNIAIFFASLTTVFIGGLGDKTFLIAAFMSMKFKPVLILIGAAGALTIILGGSAAFGAMVPELIPPELVHIVIICLFFFFGFKFLYEAYSFEDKKMIEEQQEVDKQVNMVESKLHKSSVFFADDLEQPLAPAVELTNLNLLQLGTPAVSEEVEFSPKHKIKSSPSKNHPMTPVSPGLRVKNRAIILEVFSMIFFAEWGDRSQLYTIALASQYNGFIVFLGAILGHIVCIIIAIIGGRLFAQKLSEKTILFIAGLLYLLLGIFTIID